MSGMSCLTRSSRFLLCGILDVPQQLDRCADPTDHCENLAESCNFTQVSCVCSAISATDLHIRRCGGTREQDFDHLRPGPPGAVSTEARPATETCGEICRPENDDVQWNCRRMLTAGTIVDKQAEKVGQMLKRRRKPRWGGALMIDFSFSGYRPSRDPPLGRS
jgi:hypothetical protein